MLAVQQFYLPSVNHACAGNRPWNSSPARVTTTTGGIKCSKSPLDRALFVQVTVCVDLVDLNVITLKEVEGINQWLIAILNQNRDELS